MAFDFCISACSPGATDINDTRRLLCIAPHPDDESLGCGGTLLLAKKFGIETFVILLTNGEADSANFALELDDVRRCPDAASLGRKRLQEFGGATACLGVTSVHYMNLPDGMVQAHTAVAISILASLMLSLEPDVVFTPAPSESHPDHTAAAELTTAAIRACNWQGSRPQLLGYEVWRPLAITHFVDVTTVIQAKRAALDFYKDRFHVVDLDEAAISLNHFRGATLLRPRMSYVEAFCQLEGGKGSAQERDIRA